MRVPISVADKSRNLSPQEPNCDARRSPFCACVKAQDSDIVRSRLINFSISQRVGDEELLVSASFQKLNQLNLRFPLA